MSEITSPVIDSMVIPDFRGVSCISDIKKRFYNAASSIMLEHNLIRNGYSWPITALELYLYERELWCDPTTHGNRFGTREQLKSGFWYIHRDGKLARKRLGIDITAGCENPEIHAGLLIAALGDTDGSGFAVKTILRGRPDIGDWRYTSEEMQLIKCNIHKSRIYSEPPNLRLERCAARKDPLLIGPRKLSAGVPEPFRSSLLRVATRSWKKGPEMKPLEQLP
jgi:hypothetical protein